MKKLFWIDQIKAVAIIAVIITHVSAILLQHTDNFTQTDWITGILISGSFRFCVPLFFMVSGALLMPKTYTLKEFFSKRFSRVLLPFIFWTIIYILFKIAINITHGEPWFSVSHLALFTKSLKVSAFYHLWYVYALVGIYLVFPIIQPAFSKPGSKLTPYFLIVWIITLFLDYFKYPFIEGFWDLRYFSGYLGYFVLGHYLTSNDLDKYSTKSSGWLLVITGLVITYVGTFTLSYSAQKFNNTFFHYLTPNVMMVSTGIFILLKHAHDKKTPSLYKKLIGLLSTNSYGIYLGHVLMLILMDKAGLDARFITPVAGTLITTIVTLGMSLATTYIIRKVPLGKFVSG